VELDEKSSDNILFEFSENGLILGAEKISGAEYIISMPFALIKLLVPR